MKKYVITVHDTYTGENLELLETAYKFVLEVCQPQLRLAYKEERYIMEVIER